MRVLFKKKREDNLFQRKTLQDEVSGKSLYLFDKDNRIRIIFVDIADSNYFEFFIVLMIVLATIALSIENPLDNPDSKKTAILKYSNYFFTFFFFS